ncbi:MAG: hypothetical protein DRN99_08855 [Thermoproteota archaeon]|nr:MAG: hypothetical protein DRN99_08855 [Candidatus Korarchaeota archaeon]
MEYAELRGLKTLIVGEVGSGKTSMTAWLLAQAIEVEPLEAITVLDFAPESFTARELRAGGSIREYIRIPRELRYLKAHVRGPRLQSKTREEALEIARENARETSRLLEAYIKSPTPVLFVNDVTIHLHAGSLSLLMRALGEAQTAVLNAYRGAVIPVEPLEITERERVGVDELARRVDVVIELLPAYCGHGDLT